MEELVPTEFYLSQNHPDPFEKFTHIKYCIPEKMKVRLEVFSTNGIKLITLVDEVKEPGTYQIELRADGLEVGEYICKLESDYYFETKKMVLNK